MLGVRVPPNDIPDVTPNEAGNVHPGGGGMSVNRDWKRMWPHHIPRRLKSKVLPATGSNRLRIWSHGTGPFADGEFAQGLQLRVDGTDHGVVEPDEEMPISAYQEALAATRNDWSIIPEDKHG